MTINNTNNDKYDNKTNKLASTNISVPYVYIYASTSSLFPFIVKVWVKCCSFLSICYHFLLPIPNVFLNSSFHMRKKAFVLCFMLGLYSSTFIVVWGPFSCNGIRLIFAWIRLTKRWNRGESISMRYKNSSKDLGGGLIVQFISLEV